MYHSKLYSCKQVDQSIFQIKFQGGSTIDNKLSSEINDNTRIMSAPIPLFSKIHTIQVNCNKIMFCDCYFFESVGMFCAHMVCVCKFVANTNNEVFTGFTHRDIVNRWTSSYMQLVFKLSTPKHIQKYYDTLVSNDIKGLML